MKTKKLNFFFFLFSNLYVFIFQISEIICCHTESCLLTIWGLLLQSWQTEAEQSDLWCLSQNNKIPQKQPPLTKVLSWVSADLLFAFKRIYQN